MLYLIFELLEFPITQNRAWITYKWNKTRTKWQILTWIHAQISPKKKDFRPDRWSWKVCAKRCSENQYNWQYSVFQISIFRTIKISEFLFFIPVQTVTRFFAQNIGILDLIQSSFMVLTGHALQRLPCHLAGDNVLPVVFDREPENVWETWHFRRLWI